MIVMLARGLCNRSPPAAAVLPLMRRPDLPLSGVVFVSQGNCSQVLMRIAGLWRLACTGPTFLLGSSRITAHRTSTPIEIPNSLS